MSIENDFLKLASDLADLSVSHVWDGYDGTVFLECGSLTESIRDDGAVGNPKGEISIGIEWSWSFSRDDMIKCSSQDKEGFWIPILKQIVGQKIAELNLVGIPAEIELSFENGGRLTSIAVREGEPDWMIIDNRFENAPGFEIKDGKLSY